MSELLKNAEEFIHVRSDGDNVEDAADAKLVADLAARVRELEGKDHAKEIAIGFYYWWHNQPGNNTQQGFDVYWRQLEMEKLGITEEDIAETKFPPSLNTIPVDHQLRRGNRMRNGILSTTMTREVPEEEQMPEEPIKRTPRKPITLENLKRDWLLGMTCHRQTLTVHWISDDGQWIVMKHHGHSEWVGGWNGNAYCGTYYAMFRVGDEFPDRIGKSPYFTQEGRWSKESMKWVEKVMSGWRPDNFVETQS